MANGGTDCGDVSNCTYTIASPGVLRSNADYNVVVTILDALEPCEVNISIGGGSFKLEKCVTVQPFSSETISFEIPDLDPDEEYFLDAEGLMGIEFNETIELIFESGQPLAYIQFDKQAYKRGDKVDFRVVFLEWQRLKPFKTENSVAVGLKHKEKLIFENYVELEKGVYMGQWSICDDASGGSYYMQVFVGENLITRKSFEIIDFVAPKFDVDIKAPKELTYAEKQFQIDVKANKFDGSPVTRGLCKLEVSSVAGFFSDVYIEKFMPIAMGKIETTIIDVADDLNIDNDFIECEWFSTATIMVKATVTAADSTMDQVSMTKLIILKRDESTQDEDDDENENNGCKSCRHSNNNWNNCELIETEEEEEENENPIKISITAPTVETVSVGDILSFDIKLHKPTNYCIYFVIARGNIVKSELVKVNDHSIPIIRNLKTSFIYTPRAFILAYFVCDGVLYFDEIGINFSKTFDNKLSLILPHNAEPSFLVPIEIKSSANSLVGIMAVDSKSCILNGQNDLRFEKFFDDLYNVRSQVPEMSASGRYAGLMSGVITFTNAKIDGFEQDLSGDGRYSFFFDVEHSREKNSRPRIDIKGKKRKIVREIQEQNQVYGNWLFVNKQTNENGALRFDAMTPEKPTSWLFTVFAIDEDKGFVMTKEPEKLFTKSNVDNQQNSEPQKRIPVALSQSTKFVFDHYDDNIATKSIEINPSCSSASIVEVTLSITENLFGPIIGNLNKFSRKMYCTGYLHMTTVAPNIAILEYLDQTHQFESEFAKSIKVRFPDVIKRDLDERRDDNSFGWFRSDEEGSALVTSLVLQIFQRIAKYIDVDSEIISDGLAYLVALQLEHGEIRKENQPYKNLFEKGSCVGLTSFVLLPFLKDQNVRKKYKTFIDKSFAYIVANIDPIKCVYDLAIAFYAMQLYEHPYAAQLKQLLLEIALKSNENNEMWWPYTLNPDTDPNDYSSVSEMEVSSYIALGLLETERIEVILPILKWMLPLKDLRSESMDLGLALEVILKAAVKAKATGDMQVHYKASTDTSECSGTVNLTIQNSSNIQMHVLPKSTRKIEISSKDKGTFFGNVCYRYSENMP